jgi:hypothetical protein
MHAAGRLPAACIAQKPRSWWRWSAHLVFGSRRISFCLPAACMAQSVGSACHSDTTMTVLVQHTTSAAQSEGGRSVHLVHDAMHHQTHTGLVQSIMKQVNAETTLTLCSTGSVLYQNCHGWCQNYLPQPTPPSKNTCCHLAAASCNRGAAWT